MLLNELIFEVDCVMKQSQFLFLHESKKFNILEDLSLFLGNHKRFVNRYNLNQLVKLR
jgi:hypothetical protein